MSGLPIGTVPAAELALVGTEANTVTLSCNTEVVTLGRPEVGADGVTLAVLVPSALPKGTCVANWLVSDTEGAPNGTGTITFNVSSDPVVTTTTVADAAAATETTLATTAVVDPNATSTCLLYTSDAADD